MSHSQSYEMSDMDYSFEFSRRTNKASTSTKRKAPAGRRKGKSPQSVNGIHRRRNRKMSW
jgi:hypothetical protein